VTHRDCRCTRQKLVQFSRRGLLQATQADVREGRLKGCGGDAHKKPAGSISKRAGGGGGAVRGCASLKQGGGGEALAYKHHQGLLSL
jgi:hypothetical protein